MHGTRTGKVATVQKSGAPHVAPIWFVLDGDDVMFTTHESTVKGRAITRDPRVAIAVDDDQPPFSFVTIQGIARVSEDFDELVAWATKIGGRYMGADRAEEFGRRNGVKGELLIRVTPTNVVAFSAVSD
ncbi:MAG: hypothetical protein QOJ00_470 [Actinomycetota bacterium]